MKKKSDSIPYKCTYKLPKIIKHILMKPVKTKQLTVFFLTTRDAVP